MPALIGIARLAHQAAPLQHKNFATYSELPTQRLLNRCGSTRVPFDWTINPYRGCEFACVYCYARYTHEYMELPDAAEAFESRIFAKQWSAAAFSAELRRAEAGQLIALGTATDPYQPAERRFRRTEAVLDALLAEPKAGPFRLGITTKSDLIARDVAKLAELQRRGHRVSANLTVTTMDAALARDLEPLAPRPDLRIVALSRLVDAGIPAGVSCAPILPLINDRTEQLEAVASAAAAVGARWLWGNVVFLSEPTRTVFFAFLERRFPQLAAKYRHNFRAGAYLRGGYPDHIRARLKAIRERHGLTNRPDELAAWDATPALSQLQLEF